MYGMYSVSSALIPKTAGIVMIRKDDWSGNGNRVGMGKRIKLYIHTQNISE
jgi:hypothetical protein